VGGEEKMPFQYPSRKKKQRELTNINPWNTSRRRTRKNPNFPEQVCSRASCDNLSFSPESPTSFFTGEHSTVPPLYRNK
jgi:hypothetical protein